MLVGRPPARSLRRSILIVAFEAVLDLLRPQCGTVLGERPCRRVSGNPCCPGRTRCWHGDSRRRAAVAGCRWPACGHPDPHRGQLIGQRWILRSARWGAKAADRMIGLSADFFVIRRCPGAACPSRCLPNAGAPASFVIHRQQLLDIPATSVHPEHRGNVGEHLVAGTIQRPTVMAPNTVCHGPNSSGQVPPRTPPVRPRDPFQDKPVIANRSPGLPSCDGINGSTTAPELVRNHTHSRRPILAGQ